MNYNSIYKLKENPENLNLDDDILNILKKYFNFNTNKKHKTKFFINKSDTKNKINLILNKITKDNILSLIKDFSKNINLENINDINNIYTCVYQKCMSDREFIENYIDFLVRIIFIIKELDFFSIQFFFNVMDDFINDVYLSGNNTYNENQRYNCLILFNTLIEIKFVNDDFIKYFENIILNQKYFEIDIYNWIKIQNNNKKYNELILKYMNSENKRNSILFSSLVDNKNDNNQPIKTVVKKPVKKPAINRNITEIYNLLDEYVELKIDDEIIFFINENYNNVDKKLFFCNIFLSYLNDKKNYEVFKNILLKLVKSNTINKSIFLVASKEKNNISSKIRSLFRI